MKKLLPLLAAVAVLAVTGCGVESRTNEYSKVEKKASRFQAYIPHNNVELDNYNNAQKVFDDPTTIIWCTTTWGNPSSPLITVPIAGKLTSSSTTYFAPDRETGPYESRIVRSARSVDGLFHPNPPPYRFGFTPGGQYVSFEGMPAFCTTALTKLQRQATKLSLALDPSAQLAQNQAQGLLKQGRKAAAQRALENALGG